MRTGLFSDPGAVRLWGAWFRLWWVDVKLTRGLEGRAHGAARRVWHLHGLFGALCGYPMYMLVPLKPRPSVISSPSGDIVGFRQKPLMSVLTRDIFRPVPRGLVLCCLSPNGAVYCLKYKNRPFLCERTSTGAIAPKPRMPQFSVPSEKGIRIASRHPLLSIVAFSFDDPRNESRHPQSEKIGFFPLPLPPEGTPSSPVFRNARVPLAALCGRCPSGSPAAPGIMSTIDTSATAAHILTTFFFFCFLVDQ